jgi:hypothetical protein
MSIKEIVKETLYCLWWAIVIMLVLALASLGSGCSTVEVAPDGVSYSTREYRERNPYTGPVVKDNGNGTLTVVKPAKLRFTGKTTTAREIRQWAHANGISAVGLYADSRYAQLESESAILLAHWLKRALHDLGYTYYGDARDCDNFSRIFRAFPDFFTTDDGAQALVFGIYAKMDQPFAGVSDGYHALNACWTDRGVPVFEPQGWQTLVYQDIRAWPNKSGITNILSD